MKNLVDNFDLIKPLCEIGKGEFINIFIISRKKDTSKKSRLYKQYYITDVAQLEELKEEIISLCRLFKARAYINLNSKSIDRSLKLLVLKACDRLFRGNIGYPWDLYASAAGETNSLNSKWVVDIDEDNPEEVAECVEKDCAPYNSIIAKIPTKNGYHLITHPFDLNEFKQHYPNIEVHRNNPTLLYYEETDI